jgi:uncharacterized damage-inducible protein DinB
MDLVRFDDVRSCETRCFTVKATTLLSVLLFSLVPLAGQTADNPMSTAIRSQYDNGKNNLIRAAEKMPPENYSFKPVDTVRSFGQLIGHVANAQYMFCSPILGEASPNKVNIEQTKTEKADLVAALKEAFAYCDKAYASMTDASAAGLVKFMRGDMAKIGVLSFNNMHNYEHYGNVVTYLRIKEIVPPSSEPRR